MSEQAAIMNVPLAMPKDTLKTRPAAVSGELSRYAAYLPAAVPLRTRAVPWVAALVVLALLPLVFTGTLGLSVLTQMCIAITFAFSYNLLLGGTGLLSFGHALYFGAGAYGTAHLLNHYGAVIPLALVPLAGGVVALAIAGVLALFTVRKAGVAFAMISLAVGQLVYAVATVSSTLSGGDSGISLDPTEAISWGIDFGSPRAVYFLTACWAWVGALGMFTLLKTPLGRLMSATRDNAKRVEFVGFNPVWVRGLALTLSAAFAGMAGSLYAIQFQVVTLDTLGLPQATAVLVQSYVGGYSTFLGPALGAVVLTIASANLSSLSEAWPLYTYSASLLVILFLPNGMAGALLDANRGWKHSKTNAGTPIRPWQLLLYIVCAAAIFVGFVVTVEMAHSLSASGGKPVFASLGKAFALSPRLLINWCWAIGLVVAGVFALDRLGKARSAYR